jgi:hypothetical protein
MENQLSTKQFPPIVGIGELSVLLRKTPASILADRCRAPHLIPPDCTPPGSKQPLWLLQDVLNWLAQFRRPAVAVAPRRGAPTKRERLLAQQAGVSVPELRAGSEVQHVAP